ncbi:cbb3-type cytochrome oxidase subunit 3 [Rhodoferax sediminis]|jgi:cytochrome c oxidase cbb3-type subunit 4|uniref:CcoQ/FixQ family Cbb3-type cytochrome c oxidase assembly chaperone n=1 Tax=Rhodoferax sediminis TaxID=2509614 RepID=A0A515DFZ4_9BURK|nr:cbb3-type cytochrome c oxidase subunit 3 [Rhodoferax sediminis]QDL39309.1 CcoQ/FixQ family Cbb3-type cytochrome c oxidase assembly chaperone [Rhodoferax sediminis]
MSANTVHAIAYLISFATFIGIMVWACLGRNAKAFEEAANLPFEQD